MHQRVSRFTALCILLTDVFYDLSFLYIFTALVPKSFPTLQEKNLFVYLFSALEAAFVNVIFRSSADSCPALILPTIAKNLAIAKKLLKNFTALSKCRVWSGILSLPATNCVSQLSGRWLNLKEVRSLLRFCCDHKVHSKLFKGYYRVV